jgi:rSAM/selenodomain-associated transferase 1
MDRSVRDSVASGVSKVVVIGTDAPDLGEHSLRLAFAALDSADLVLGPATDGGYYLIGLTKSQPALFHKIGWGSDRVLRETIERAKEQGLRFVLLDLLSDVDRAEDLSLLQRYPHLRPERSEQRHV